MVSIWALSSEQRSAIEKQQWDWLPAASNADRFQAAMSIADMYTLMELPAPQVIWCEGPFQLAAMPFLLNLIMAQHNPSQRLTLVASPHQITRHLREKLTHPLWQKAINNLLSQLNPSVQARLLKNGVYTRLDTTQSVRHKIQKTALALAQDLGTKMFSKFSTETVVQIRDYRTPSHTRALATINQLQWHLKTHYGVNMSSDLFQGDSANRFSDFLNDGPAAQLIEQLGAETCQQIIDFVWRPQPVYSHHKLTDVRFWRTSRLQWLLCNMLKDFEFRGSWGACSPDHFTLYQLPLKIGVDCYDQELIDKLQAVTSFRDAAFAYNPFRTLCFVSDFPTEVKLDEQGRFHDGDGPALAFRDGYEMFALGGLNIEPELIKNPAALTTERIDKEPNIELRRVLIDRYGLDRYMLDTGARVRSTDLYGVLYEKRMRSEENMVVVKVVNSTAEPDGTFREYFLRVPPDMRTPREAIAWTFGMPADEYGPAVQT